MKRDYRLAVDIPKGAVIWSGKTFRGTQDTCITWEPGRHSSGTRAEVKAYPYLKALGIPFIEDKEYPLLDVHSDIGNSSPTHPAVVEFYKFVDNPDNESALGILRSLIELEVL